MSLNNLIRKTMTWICHIINDDITSLNNIGDQKLFKDCKKNSKIQFNFLLNKGFREPKVHFNLNINSFKIIDTFIVSFSNKHLINTIKYFEIWKIKPLKNINTKDILGAFIGFFLNHFFFKKYYQYTPFEKYIPY